MDKPEQISEFFDSLKEHEEQHHKHRIMWEHVKKAEAELDTMRGNNDSLNKILKNNIEGDDSNISTKYVNLKERHDTVLKEIEDLKNKYETLKINTANEKENMALESEAKIKREEELGMKRIDELKSKIENRKLEHNVKVEKLNNELELAHATADLKQDEIETTLLAELMDLNMKIWRQQNANTALQIEIDDLKRRQQADPALIKNYENPLNPDDLQFFHLNNLDDLFNMSLNDDNTSNHTVEQERHRQVEAVDDCHTSYNVNVEANEHDRHQAGGISKYPPLQIIRKRKPYPGESEHTKGSGPNNKSGKQAHFEFGIVHPTSGDEQPRSVLKNRDARSLPITSVEQIIYTIPKNKHNERAAQKVTFVTDHVTGSTGGNNALIVDGREGGQSRLTINKRISSKINDKKSLTKIVKKEAYKEKENNGILETYSKTVKTNPVKKRKLFNLDDLDYLDKIQIMNSDDSE